LTDHGLTGCGGGQKVLPGPSMPPTFGSKPLPLPTTTASKTNLG